MGKYLAAMAIMGFVYLVLLFLIETNLLWGLKARFPDFNRKRLLVSGSVCNLGSLGPRAGSTVRGWEWP